MGQALLVVQSTQSRAVTQLHKLCVLHKAAHVLREPRAPFCNVWGGVLSIGLQRGEAGDT